MDKTFNGSSISGSIRRTTVTLALRESSIDADLSIPGLAEGLREAEALRERSNISSTQLNNAVMTSHASALLVDRKRKCGRKPGKANHDDSTLLTLVPELGYLTPHDAAKRLGISEAKLSTLRYVLKSNDEKLIASVAAGKISARAAEAKLTIETGRFRTCDDSALLEAYLRAEVPTAKKGGNRVYYEGGSIATATKLAHDLGTCVSKLVTLRRLHNTSTELHTDLINRIRSGELSIHRATRILEDSSGRCLRLKPVDKGVSASVAYLPRFKSFVGKYFKEARLRLGYSMQHVCQLSNKCSAWYSQIEMYGVYPKLPEFIRLCAILDVNPESLFENDRPEGCDQGSRPTNGGKQAAINKVAPVVKRRKAARHPYGLSNFKLKGDHEVKEICADRAQEHPSYVQR